MTRRDGRWQDETEYINPLMIKFFLLSVPLGEQASGRRWDCSDCPNGTMMCRGYGVPTMVTPAIRTTAVLFGFSNLTNKLDCVTLRRAQKFGYSELYKNFDFLHNPLMTTVFFAISAEI